jgi:hypothetical protein
MTKLALCYKLTGQILLFTEQNPCIFYHLPLQSVGHKQTLS